MEDNTNKKKILILVDWFTPGYKAGGPIQSCLNVSVTLKDDFDIYVLTSDTDFGESMPYKGITPDQWTTNLDPKIKVYYMSNSNRTRGLVGKIIQEVDADFVYLNQLFSPLLVVYPLWLAYRGAIRGKIIVCPRGALYETALNIKRYKKIPFLKLFHLLGIHKKITFHATNEREKKAILSYFPGTEVRIADNLPNSRQLPFQPLKKDPGTIKCVFIARIHPIKNLLFFLKLLKEVKSNVKLSIIGPIEDQAYWNLCAEMIKQLPQNIQVNDLGPIPNPLLSEYIVSNHLFVSTTTGENFGHAIFEAFLAGRPVLISDQTPWQNLQSSGIGWDLPLQDPLNFVAVVETAASWDQANFNSCAKGSWEFAHNFIKDPLLKKQYQALFA